MRPVLLLVALVLPATLGCAGVFAPEPTEGDYAITTSGLDLSDNCEDGWGMSVSYDADLVVAVQVSDEEISFVGDFDCERDHAAFECVLENAEPVDGMDATVSTRLDGDGEWTSATTFEASFDTVFDCSGGDCGALADPCTVRYDWDGVLDD
jgi:hypothetical protein